ncbi:MAG: ankyrin repeat domain-containing protein [Pirellulaceae bacterium]
MASVDNVLARASSGDAWIAESKNGLVTFWDKHAANQDAARICFLAESVSSALEAVVVAFLVHDSDVLCYWLYDRGTQMDEYNSCPQYWGDETADVESLLASTDVLVRYCQAGTTAMQLESIMGRSTLPASSKANVSEAIDAEKRLAQLALLLGLETEYVTIDYSDIGRDFQLEQLGEACIGSHESVSKNQAPDSNLAWGHDLPPAPLHRASAKGDVAAIDDLIASGVDVNEIPQGFTVTALAVAAGEGSVVTIRKLVALGALLDKKGQEGTTPLRCAVAAGKLDNIRALVELGADINEYCTETGTLLHVAIIANASLDVVQLLLGLGLDDSRENASGLTALQLARSELIRLRQVQTVLQDLGGAPAAKAIDVQIRSLESIEVILRDNSK